MLSKKIGIDLGTSTVLIYVKGARIVVNEPSLVAVNRDGTRTLAVGRQDVLEETPPEFAADPQTSVVRGTGLAIENFEVLKRNLSYVR